MERFGDFQLLEKISEKGSVVRYKATHPRQEKPLLLNIYQGLAPKEQAILREKFNHLMGLSHPHLEPHVGHGMVGEIPYRVTTFVEGINLAEFLASLGQRRVILPMDNLFSIARALSKGLHALHLHNNKGDGYQLTHGEVSAANVHIAPNGRVLLSGAGSWAHDGALDPMEKIWDGAGLAALIYQMLRATKLGNNSPSISPDLDQLLRIALGIGEADEMITAKVLGMRLREIAIRQHVYTTLDRFKDLAHRTCRLVFEQKTKITSETSTSLDKMEGTTEEEATSLENVAEKDLTDVSEGPPDSKENHLAFDLEGFEAETSSVEILAENLNVGAEYKIAPKKSQNEKENQENEALQTQEIINENAENNVRDEDPKDIQVIAESQNTKKERLSFLQWVKNKKVFSDALLQMCMDSYEKESDMLTALWSSRNIDQEELLSQLGEWLKAPCYDSQTILACQPIEELIEGLPASLILGTPLLPLRKEQNVLICLACNPFNDCLNQELLKIYQVEELRFELAPPRLVIEHSLRVLQSFRLDGGVSLQDMVEIEVLVFDPKNKFPQDLARKLAGKGWLVQWTCDSDVVLQMAIMTGPAAILCLTQKDKLAAAQLIVELKTQPSLGKTACFAMGEGDNDEEIEKILDLGAEDYFAFPVSVDSVVAKLKRAFNRNLNYDSTPPIKVQDSKGPPPIPSSGIMEDMILAAGLNEEHEHVEPAGMMGRLGNIKMFDLVQNLVLRKKTACIKLLGAQEGRIFLSEGTIADAEIGQERGQEAFFTLVNENEGLYTVLLDECPSDVSIERPTYLLLLDAYQNWKRRQ